MNPPRDIASMIGSGGSVHGLGSSSGLTPGQSSSGLAPDQSSSGFTLVQPSMMETQPQLQPAMTQNTSGLEIIPFNDEDNENRSQTENHERTPVGDENERPRKKPYHRHTQHQIQALEAFFKECQHPDDKQRKELGRELGLEAMQIKFWFQNKRTQMKTQHERLEISYLRAEMDKIRAEALYYRNALMNYTCPNCGGPGEVSPEEHQSRFENAQIRQDNARLLAIATKYEGNQVRNYLLCPPPEPQLLQQDVPNFGSHPGSGEHMFGAGGDVLKSIPGPSDGEKPIIIQLAVSAMEELMGMAQIGEPLWFTSLDGTVTLLSEEQYVREFPSLIGPKPKGFISQASREIDIVLMDHSVLVETMMDVNQWSTIFSGIVSRAMTLEVIVAGADDNCNGTLQVMAAEFQVPTPLVPTQECYYVRYCRQHGEGTWAIVDVSLDQSGASLRCRKRPSGCLIQAMPNGYSKVIWVEHVEVNVSGVHSLYQQLVSSGLAFGAKRWVATLDRHCDRLASATATNMLALGVITDQEKRKSLLKLAERIVTSFCGGLSASTAQTWSTLTGGTLSDLKMITKKNVDDPGRPAGIVLSAATSFWLPVPPKRVFDFLRDWNSRPQWDVLSRGGVLEEMAHIGYGRDPGNSVSLLRVNSGSSNQGNMLILQESFTDPTASFVVYAPIDVDAMNEYLKSGHPNYVALLPSGFSVFPDGNSVAAGSFGCAGTGGSLLTVAFQILVDSAPNSDLHRSISTVNHLITRTVEKIKGSLPGRIA